MRETLSDMMTALGFVAAITICFGLWWVVTDLSEQNWVAAMQALPENFPLPHVRNGSLADIGAADPPYPLHPRARISKWIFDHPNSFRGLRWLADEVSKA